MDGLLEDGCMYDYEWIQELKDRLNTEKIVNQAKSQFSNRVVLEQVVDAARQQAKASNKRQMDINTIR